MNSTPLSDRFAVLSDHGARVGADFTTESRRRQEWLKRPVRSAGKLLDSEAEHSEALGRIATSVMRVA